MYLFAHSSTVTFLSIGICCLLRMSLEERFNVIAFDYTCMSLFYIKSCSHFTKWTEIQFTQYYIYCIFVFHCNQVSFILNRIKYRYSLTYFLLIKIHVFPCLWWKVIKMWYIKWDDVMKWKREVTAISPTHVI